MADFLSHKLLDFHSINRGASLPFHVSPHLSLYTVCLSPPKRRSSPPISCNLSSHPNSTSSSIPPPIAIVSTSECLDGSFLFRFGDPSEIVAIDEDVNDTTVSDSDLREGEGLDEEENKASSISKAVNRENIIISSDDAVLEPNAVGIKTVHVAELKDAIEQDDFERVSVGGEKKKTSASLLETITHFHRESHVNQINVSITSPELGIVVDTETTSSFDEEAPGEINDDDGSMYPEVSNELDLSSKGCDSDEVIEIDENRLNVDSLNSLIHAGGSVTDDYEVELMPKHARLEADSVVVDNGACDTVLPNERVDSDVASIEISDSGVEIEETDNVAKGQEIPSPTLALASGVASLACASQVLTGVEDAYLIAGQKWFIVASSVGQWSFEGMKPGLYAHELIQNFQSLTLNNDSCKANVREVLKQSAATVQSPGLASVLIAHFDNKVLHVANIGDTGFIIMRNGIVHKSSSPINHEFNLPVQIGSSDDPLQVAEEHQVHLDDGDIIIMATDGLFDNLYEKDIASIVSKSWQDNTKPKELAELLATRAQEVGKSTSAWCPFADEAQAAGYTGFTGGKLDHVTVIVSQVKKQLSPQE